MTLTLSTELSAVENALLSLTSYALKFSSISMQLIMGQSACELVLRNQCTGQT